MSNDILASSPKQPTKPAVKVFDAASGNYWELIPLNKWDASKTRHGRTRKTGKAPFHYNWTKREYDRKQVRAQVEAGHNFGHRIRRGQLVLDCDPRNGGVQGFKDLCRELGEDFTTYRRHITGSGGWHIFMTVPETFKAVDTIEGFPGVEFKGHGRQVVMPGSIHPDTKKFYKVEDDNDPRKPAPKRLLRLVKRPVREGTTAGGEFEPHDIAKRLELLDPVDFAQHDIWLAIMMACHHATAGEARAEFVDWSTGDPQYAGDADVIGRRWDSLHKDKDDGVTYKTLNKYLRDKGHGDAALTYVADDAFADDMESDFENPDDAESDFENPAEADSDFESNDEDTTPEWLEEFNAKYCGIVEGDKYRITWRQQDPEDPSRVHWAELSFADFKLKTAGRFVESGDKAIPIATAWHDHPRHRRADGVTINPDKPPGEVYQDDDGHLWLNQWGGWGVEPKPGPVPFEKTMLYKLIHDVLCSGTRTHYEYLMNWLAFKVQNPSDLPGVAVVFRGPRGVGKTTLGELMVRIFGAHGQVVHQVEQLAGRFTGHLQTTCLLFGDECFWGGNKAHESALKKRITDPRMLYESKGKNAVNRRNRVGMMLATNEEWAVPAADAERRFFVLDVPTTWQVPQDGDNSQHPNQKKWNALHAELDGGGREAFLHHLLSMQVTKHPRNNVPQTKALGEQKFHGLDDAPLWFVELMQDSLLPSAPDFRDVPDWTGDVHVRPEEFTGHFRAWQHSRKPRANVSSKGLYRDLKHFGIARGRDPGGNRNRHWIIPPLAECRRKCIAKLGFNPFEEESEGPAL